MTKSYTIYDFKRGLGATNRAKGASVSVYKMADNTYLVYNTCAGKFRVTKANFKGLATGNTCSTIKEGNVYLVKNGKCV